MGEICKGGGGIGHVTLIRRDWKNGVIVVMKWKEEERKSWEGKGKK